MKKILDFIIIFLLVFLIMQYINWNGKQATKNIENTIILKTIKNSYSVPAWIKLEIENKTKKDLKIEICKDLKIKYINTDTFIDLPEKFCKNNILDIKSWTKKEVDYSSVYEKFKSKWNYLIKLSDNYKKQISKILWKDKKDFDKITANFDIEPRGTIAKIFIYLFYAPAYNLIIFLVKLFSWSFGWAIIVITIFLRLILLWPQHKMLVSQKKLQAIQPKIKKIQEEHKANPQVLGQKMMELYKTEKVNPMGSCWFMLIQMPILLVIYNVIRFINDNSNHYYLYSFLKDFDFNSMSFEFFWINLLGKWWVSWLILALIVWILQFIQIYLSNKNAKKSNNSWVVLEKKKWAKDYNSMMPDPEMMQKVMLYWMPAMVAVFTYNFPAGLWIYWGISTLFMIIQQLIVNRKK